MSGFNPYEVLGVGIDASEKEIKQAYRRKAKHSHPDGGGNAEQFEQLRTSYTVLSDSTKRSQYDSTGKIIEDDVDQSMGIVLNIINSLINSDIPLHVDIIDVARNTINTAIEEFEKRIELNKKKQKKFSRMLMKFKHKKTGTNNVISNVIATKHADLATDIAQTAKKVVDSKKALVILKDFTFDKDPEPLPENTGTGSYSTFFKMHGGR